MQASSRSWLAASVAMVYRAWSATWRVRFVDRHLLEDALGQGPAVIAIWHGEQAPLLHAHGHMGIDGMASQSPDGALLAGIIARLGYGVIRGSSSRGGVGALRVAMRAIDAGRSPALAVDGPRGPFHVAQLGALHLSARTGRPVIYMVARASRALRMRTWDRFVLPLPFSRIVIGYGRMSPPAKDKPSVEAAAAELGERMSGLGLRLSPLSSASNGGPASAG
jgi:lysophospholipid acyltransferase (LPLAT)-like uncharacterized protein